MKYAVKRKYLNDMLIIEWSDGTYSYYDAFALGCEWFSMSNDSFYEMYHFNFTPHEIPGLYERCRRSVYPGENKRNDQFWRGSAF